MLSLSGYILPLLPLLFLKYSGNMKLFPATKLMLFSLSCMLLLDSSQLSPPPTVFIFHSLAQLFSSPLCLHITMCTILQSHLPNLWQLFIQYIFIECLLYSRTTGLKNKNTRIWDYFYLIFKLVQRLIQSQDITKYLLRK